MKLELHVSNPAGSLFAKVNSLNHDYQAEMHVKETAFNEAFAEVVLWRLMDGHRVRAEWRRDRGSKALPSLVFTNDEYLGEWQKNPPEISFTC